MRGLRGLIGGRFELLRRIGAGAHATVYEAQHIGLTMPVAVKVQKHTAPRGWLVREGRMLARLHHHAFVRALDVGSDRGEEYLALELIRGPTVRELLSTGPMPRERALEIILQVVDAARAANAQGVVIRDIKPDNLMLDEDGNARIIDLGIACCVGESADDARQSGTWGYVPPEMVATGRIDAQADQYAIMTTLYEMLASRHPFSDGGKMPTRAELLRRARYSTAPPPISGIPDRLAEVVARALAPEPSRRFRDLADLEQALKGS